MNAPVAITLVSGFLGAGKTTYMLRDLLPGAGDETLVILNELGDGASEATLFARTQPLVIAGGCICCERADELRTHLREALGRRRETPLEHIVIETTGLAHPERVARLLGEDPLLHHRSALREVVVVADALALRATLAAHAEAARQIAAADRVVLSKTDICDDAGVGDAVALVRQLNPDAPLDGPAAGRAAVLAAPPPDLPVSASEHVADVQTLSLELDTPLTWQVFGAWLTLLLQVHGERVLRFKASIDAGVDGPVLLDAVQDVVHPPRHMDGWGGQKQVSLLTFIARGLDVDRVHASLTAFERAFAPLAADPGASAPPAP
jgi:G3E family GTPase